MLRSFVSVSAYASYPGPVYNSISSRRREKSMKAVVVYESIWGNTAAVARAIAEGLGPDVPALSTSEATSQAIAGVDLLVAGAPVQGFSLPSEKMREGIRADPRKNDASADFSHRPLRTWLEALPAGAGTGRSAAFETRVRGPFGHATKAIVERLEGAGYPLAAEPEGFVVKGTKGPLRDGELERARDWGAELARSLK
jgi:flavodoxin